MLSNIISMNKKSELSKFKLGYEMTPNPITDSKKAIVRVPAHKKQIKQKKQPKLKIAVKNTLEQLNNRLSKLTTAIKKDLKSGQKTSKKRIFNGILGIGMLFVVVSIAYSTYITIVFVDGNVSLVALTPQVIFALFTSLKAFSKIYK